MMKTMMMRKHVAAAVPVTVNVAVLKVHVAVIIRRVLNVMTAIKKASAPVTVKNANNQVVKKGLVE